MENRRPIAHIESDLEKARERVDHAMTSDFVEELIENNDVPEDVQRRFRAVVDMRIPERELVLVESGD